MTKDEPVSLKIEKANKDLIDKFQPHFGSSTGEVMRNLSLRWIEDNLLNPKIIELAKRKAIRLDVTEDKMQR